MTTDSHTKKHRKQRLKLKAWIGNLVGYESAASTGFGFLTSIRSSELVKILSMRRRKKH
jgi:hypothetical protein